MKDQSNEFESFDIRKIANFLLDCWKSIIFGIVLACLIGFLYVRYTTPEYRSSAKVLVENSNENSAFAGSELQGLGLLNEGIGAESEAEILKSRQLLTRVVSVLDLTTIAHVYGGFTKIKKSELDITECPIWISLADTTDEYFKPIELKVTTSNNIDFNVTFDEGGKMTVKNGDTIKKQGHEFIFEIRNQAELNKSQSYKFTLLSKDQAITDLVTRISINREQAMEGILGISIVGLSIVKNNRIINELIRQQQKSAIDQKNLTANKTNVFLSNRLALIEYKLDSIENIGRRLKSENGIIDITSELPAILTQERELEQELFELSFNEAISEQMFDFFDSEEDLQALIPVSLSFESSSLNIAISEYNQLVLERNRLLASSNINNPAVVKRKDDIIRLRGNLKKSIQTYATSVKEQKKLVASKLSSSSIKKSSIPKYELDYRDAMRDQKISESIYLLLLQKKEENEILLASTESNVRVIDYAYAEVLPVSPNKKVVYILAVLLGAIIPVLFFYIKSLLNNKLSSREEIEELGLPVIGEVPLSEDDIVEVIKSDSRNPISESFISIRTNIGFMLNKNTSNVIMVTSSIAGEGKTYVSINLAKTFTESGKKVVVLGLDLRAPKLLEHIDTPYTIGVSNYISSDDITIENIIYRTPLIPNLDCIPCGTIPPNPSELLLRDRFAELMEELRQKYDIIIVDTSPVGLVSDTLSISEYADMLVYVSRIGHVKSDFLTLPKKLYNENKFKSLTVLVNGSKRSNNGYGYGYGYGDTGADGKKKGFLKRIFSKRT